MITGQILYFVPEGRRQGNGAARELRVTNVGRKWVTLETIPTQPGHIAHEFGRCDKATGWVDGKGYSNPGRCWPSQAAYEQHRERCEVWNSLRMALELRHPSTEPPAGVTRLDILAARELLKL